MLDLKFICLSLFPLLYAGVNMGQNARILWASEVLDVSSEHSDFSSSGQRYKAVQILGEPNTMPQGGKSACAWTPSRKINGNYQWIMLAFPQIIQAQQVVIVENYQPGMITKVYAIDNQKAMQLVYENKGGEVPETSARILTIATADLSFPIAAIRIETDPTIVGNLSQIDAVGISQSEQPYKPVVNTYDIGETTSSIAHREELIIENLGDRINTPFEEVFPIIAADGKTLFFDRKNHPKNTRPITSDKDDDIWYSIQVGGVWQEAINIGKPLNNASPNYVCSVSPDGNTFLLGNIYQKNKTASQGVSMAHRTKDGWSFPVKQVIKEFENFNQHSEYSLAANQKIMLLAIEMADSKGDRDIYVSFKESENQWSKPVNLGGQVNTAELEMTPFLAADNKTLYFASRGFSGYGSVDMYFTKRLDETWTNWSSPINLGDQLNSKEWDASYTIDAFGEYAYFVSYNNSIGKSADIFRVELPDALKPDRVTIVYGKVYNSKTKQPILADIFYENLHTGKELGQGSANPNDGSYKIILPRTEAYAFWAAAEGFLSVEDNIDFEKEHNLPEKIKRDLYLTPIEIGQVIKLNNVFFVQSKAELMPESYTELNRLVAALLMYKEVNVMIEGHTDLAGDPRLNMDLSQRRVAAITAYFVVRGIGPNRLSGKAFGDTQPLTMSRDPKSKKSNRRVEFRIIK